MSNVVAEHPAAQARGVDSVSPVERGLVPKQVKIVDKTEPARAGGVEPGVQAEESAEAPHATVEGGEGPRDKNRLTAVGENLKKFLKMVLGHLRLTGGSVVKTQV